MSLFLALNIFLCYGGLYRDSLAASGALDAKTSGGCHGMMTHESKISGSGTIPGIVNDKDVQDRSCCHESLTNANPDLNARVDTATIDRSLPHVINESKSKLNKFLDGSPREHDPPDLQISFSTFLL